ncbi:MAG: NUDIX hydrolase [Bacteroidetes bacterium]|nr:NUDIX hydrolase [Bacteroidota bacterium]
MNKVHIMKEESVFRNEHMNVTEGIMQIDLDGYSKTYSRMRINRTDAAVVLIKNTDRDTVVLVKQFRYAVAGKIQEGFPELVAGKIDEGESPGETAIRESAEECGYRIRPENLQHLASYFVSPGYTSERFHLFYATVTNADKLEQGGGLEAENEFIEVLEIDVKTFLEMADAHAIADGKTLMGALYMKLKGL